MAHQQLIDHLLKHSVKRGDFTLKSGAKSDWFLDVKQTACDPVGIGWIADAALAAIEPYKATAIGGMTIGADPVAYGISAIAAERWYGVPQLRSFTIRKEPKPGGTGGRIAGALRPGDRVVVTEDCATRGVTLVDAINVIREFGAEPVLALAVVDRGGTAGGLMVGVPFVALVTAPELGFPFDAGVDPTPTV